MPDPLLYGEAFAAAAVASLCCLLLLRRGTGRWQTSVAPCGGLVAVVVGSVVGLAVLGISPRVPPRNGLDRFLLIGLPSAFVVEFASALCLVKGAVASGLRLVAAALSGWVLLYGSAYLQPANHEWTAGEMYVSLACCTVGLFVAWEFAARLDEGKYVPAAPLSLALAICSAGVLVMLAGYLKGGSAAFPLAAALVGYGLAQRLSANAIGRQGTLSFGIVGLFGLLFIGRYFGDLSTTDAVIVFAAPLAGWLSEYILGRSAVTWRRTVLHVLIVVVPLAIVLVQAKSRFDSKLGPLMQETSIEPRSDARCLRMEDAAPRLLLSPLHGLG